MRAIRSKNMKPEMIVRKLLHALGYRYRLHAKELPGKPDIVFRKRRKCIFVHGCYWHQHPDPQCADARLPKSNLEYWLPKLARNVERDAQHAAALEQAGWKVETIWECETKDQNQLAMRLREFLAR
ncbi:T/G mismatch-specific endonuclease [Sphingomonas paucimobilis]|nr:T/G mismatch-specific endonuclease [Sphingomonas paucimobilis]